MCRLCLTVPGAGGAHLLTCVMNKFLPWLFSCLGLVFVPAIAGAPSAATRPHVLPFIADDYPKALAQARARKLPIFIESWAPW